jgi:hypothetical protein
MRAMRRTVMLLGLFVVPASASAQRAAQRRMTAGESARGGERGMQENPMQARRARIQREIRMAFTRAVRNQVGLSDDQMRKLAPINQKYVRERQEIARQERDTRLELRAELMKAQPNQDTVSAYLARLQAFPRQRLDLNDAEARELGGIMTPVQLAKFRALEERVQRQLNMMRGGGRGARGEPMGPPPDSGGGGGGGGGD